MGIKLTDYARSVVNAYLPRGRVSEEDLATVINALSCSKHDQPTEGCKECYYSECYYENERFYYWGYGGYGEPPVVEE
jgi:hypothetical protein